MDVDGLSAPKAHSLIKTDNKDSVKCFFFKAVGVQWKQDQP